ncbi:MAG: gluconate 2-dehydrogenase subunit 3 family protein [Bryobacteraceae bacterium]
MPGNRTRREALKAVALPVLPVLAQQHQHESPEKATVPAGPYTPQAFPAARFALLGAFVDVIIPRTDTPGASDAGVPMAIDKLCVNNPKLKKDIGAGLARLEKAKFTELDEAGRIAIVKPMSDANDPFFRGIKNMTIDAYYTSREGLTQELGWHANTFVAEFKGCTHPEHQS